MPERDLDLDRKQVRRAFGRAAGTYDAAAVLQREIGERLLSRLDLIRHAPHTVLDLGCGTGYCTERLERRYRGARVFGLDIAHAMTAQARANTGWFRRRRFVCGAAEALPFAADSLDLVVSNLTLQWCDPDAVFRECMRVLRPNGLLMFTSFGPDTLKELRAAWAAVDAAPHVHTFIDMHDVGDALVRAGFADPVMDAERFTLTYPDVAGVLRDLKNIGAHNIAATRHAGLTGKNRFARFVAAYEALRTSEGRIPATYEAVYGHAWLPARKPQSVRQPDGTVTVPLAGLKRR